jgi:hypothetical protein
LIKFFYFLIQVKSDFFGVEETKKNDFGNFLETKFKNNKVIKIFNQIDHDALLNFILVFLFSFGSIFFHPFFIYFGSEWYNSKFPRKFHGPLFVFLSILAIKLLDYAMFSKNSKQKKTFAFFCKFFLEIMFFSLLDSIISVYLFPMLNFGVSLFKRDINSVGYLLFVVAIRFSDFIIKILSSFF